MTPISTISTNDRLALFGLGLFETLLITTRGALFDDLHWERMYRGAKILGLKMPDQQKWRLIIQDFVRQYSYSDPFALRITLSGGTPATNLPSQLLLHQRPIPYTPEQYSSGIKLHLLPYPRNEQSPLCNIKSTNYLENLLAKEEAISNGCDEGVWLNTQGYLAEGTMSNLFFIKDKTLYTPALTSGCLPGTRRQIILDLARSKNIFTKEGFYTLNDLLSADEVFMTNSLMGLMPVRSLNGCSYRVSLPHSKDSIMRNLEHSYSNLIKEQ